MPVLSPSLSLQQVRWLESLGIDFADEVVDCDPDTWTITFKDGTVRRVAERWTRVMGYHRPVSAFNGGKRAEHAERRYFSENPGKTAEHKGG